MDIKNKGLIPSLNSDAVTRQKTLNMMQKQTYIKQNKDQKLKSPQDLELYCNKDDVLDTWAQN